MFRGKGKMIYFRRVLFSHQHGCKIFSLTQFSILNLTNKGKLNGRDTGEGKFFDIHHSIDTQAVIGN